MKQNLENLDIRRFKSLFPSTLDAELGDDFFFATLELHKEDTSLIYPLRLDGYVAVFCMDGCMEVSINLNTFQVEKNTVFVNIPGNIFQISAISHETVKIFIIAMSEEFLFSIHLDFKKMFNDSMSFFSHPAFRMSEREISYFRRYKELVSELLHADIGYKKEIIGSMISSVFYLFGSIFSEKLSQARDVASGFSKRREFIFDQFLKLVTEYHGKERRVSFYADKLCLSPKYLSKVIKTVSGRSAPDWIDAFVVLEAKNMLRYSDLTIKEIVYRLNFPNQSVFYRFFMTHVGQSPTAYRNL